MGKKCPLQCTNKNENPEKDWHWLRMLLDQTEKICRLMLLWAIPILDLLIYSTFYPIFQQMFNKYLWKICNSRFLIYLSAIHTFFYQHSYYRVKYVDRSEIKTGIKRERQSSSCDTTVWYLFVWIAFLHGLLAFLWSNFAECNVLGILYNHRQIRDLILYL